MQEITPQEGLKRVQAGAVLVDVREAEEFRDVHAQGAMWLPLGELEARYKELPHDRELVMICRSGARSGRATEFLEAKGYNAVNLAGGTLAWQEAGLPTEAGDPVSDTLEGQQTEAYGINLSSVAPAGMPAVEQVLEALKVVKDPEIPVNVVDLGLVYGVGYSEGNIIDITMTLTSVGCPVQDLIRSDAEMAVMRLDGVERVNVEFVWSPPWSPDKMTEDGKRQMRMFGFNI